MHTHKQKSENANANSHEHIDVARMRALAHTHANTNTGTHAHDTFRVLMTMSIDRPFIVLAETKSSKHHIPVWAWYSPLRTRVEAHANTLSP